ncbi:SDR family NAD(P)-dependent oxidoreductase [Modestobacter roseus]|uniref:NADP-dependent 3-hydroxy acid dehydrogenase YdfG n=1 Tax=Modestobacter roseus TaxID=1181884 RepID=A0A562ITW5_9ACTN|nr:SDR family NAD(P)-dependent oxidoreductase [Modestobacter roseus]MQA33081.1 SDR family NAD(P)-dependent oxidoreductase [Modestobacter roseus]TWH74461.1 NADP-dependent 3-hydroxy acid dehydrogenase YdfG [Modestobacter roseus]
MDTISLITGGNKGIGHETARRLRDAGHTVLIGARDAGRGRAAADELGVGLVHLDVTDQASVDRAAAQVREDHGRLDVLVNNAAVNSVVAPLAGTTATEAAALLDVNVLGAMRVTNAFLPLLHASRHARIVNVSSRVGSFAATIEQDMFDWRVVPPVYAISKTALTMLTLKYARELPGILVNAADPGYTKTDLNDHQGTQTVTEGTDAIVHLATLGAGGPTGTCISREDVVPW